MNDPTDAREPSGVDRNDVRRRGRQALSLVHGIEVPRAPVLEILDLVLRLGMMPSEEERERMLDAKLRDADTGDGGTAPPSSPPTGT